VPMDGLAPEDVFAFQTRQGARYPKIDCMPRQRGEIFTHTKDLDEGVQLPSVPLLITVGLGVFNGC
jgi:hypothetical protein